MTKNISIVYEINDIDQIIDNILANYPTKLFLLDGDLGAGKTTLVKSIVNAIGIDTNVSSPTFNIINEYYSNDVSIKAYHIDLYRIENFQEIQDLGLLDLLESDNWVFIEWPSIIEEYCPLPYLKLSFSIVDSSNRQLSLSFVCEA